MAGYLRMGRCMEDPGRAGHPARDRAAKCPPAFRLADGFFLQFRLARGPFPRPSAGQWQIDRLTKGREITTGRRAVRALRLVAQGSDAFASGSDGPDRVEARSAGQDSGPIEDELGGGGNTVGAQGWAIPITARGPPAPD